MILAWEKREEHKWESLLGKINYMNPQISNSTFTGVLFTVHVIIIHQGSFFGGKSLKIDPQVLYSGCLVYKPSFSKIKRHVVE